MPNPDRIQTFRIMFAVRVRGTVDDVIGKAHVTEESLSRDDQLDVDLLGIWDSAGNEVY